MVCSKCGHTNKNGSKFCNECGAKLHNPAPKNTKKDDIIVAEMVLNEKNEPKQNSIVKKINSIFKYVELGLLALAILFTGLSFISDATLIPLIVIGTIFYILLFLAWLSCKVYNKIYENKTSNLPQSSKPKSTCLLLCVLLGLFGVHRYYVRKIGTGILWTLTLGCLGIGYIVDIVMIAYEAFTDKEDALIKE